MTALETKMERLKCLIEVHYNNLKVYSFPARYLFLLDHSVIVRSIFG